MKINWPKKVTMCPHQKINPEQLCLACEAYNETIDACIAAEKEARIHSALYGDSEEDYSAHNCGANGCPVCYAAGWDDAIGRG